MTGTCHSLSLILLVGLSLLVPTVHGQGVLSRQVASPTDESELRRLAALYVIAFAGNDQQALANIVSSASMFHSSTQTDIAERNDAWQSVMALSTHVELRGFNIEKVVLSNAPGDGWGFVRGTSGPKSGTTSAERNRASVFLSISILAFDAKTGRPRNELLNMHRVIECAKLDPGYRFGKKRIKRIFADISYREERPVWLIVGDEPDLKQLSKGILAAKTEQAARAYLALESEESLRRLAPEVIKEAAVLFEQEDYARGLHALQMNQVIEREIKIKEQSTEKLRAQDKAENVLRNIEYSKKSLTEAREEFAKLEAVPVEKQTQAIKDTKAFRADDIARSLSQIARYYSDGGQLGEALKYYNQSLREYEKLGNKRMMADVLEEMGKIHLKHNDEARALDYWLQSYQLGMEGQDAKDAAIASGEISSDSGRYYVEYKDGLPSKAVGQFTSAFTGFYGRDNLARTLDSIADLYLKQKNYEQSVVFYRRSADQYKLMVAHGDEARKKESRYTATDTEPKGKATAKVARKNIYSENFWLGILVSELTSIADVYKAQGRYDKAAEYYEQSAEEMKLIGKPDAAIELYSGMSLLGNEYAQLGQDEKAVALYERSLSRLKELNAKSEAGALYLMLAQFNRKQNNHVQAAASVEKGLAMLLPLSEEADENDELLVAVLYCPRRGGLKPSPSGEGFSRFYAPC